MAGSVKELFERKYYVQNLNQDSYSRGYPLLEMSAIDGFGIGMTGKEGLQWQTGRIQWPTVKSDGVISKFLYLVVCLTATVVIRI
jgi:hypothetical protein